MCADYIPFEGHFRTVRTADHDDYRLSIGIVGYMHGALTSLDSLAGSNIVKPTAAPSPWPRIHNHDGS